MFTITSKATGALLVFVAFATLVSGCDDGDCNKGGLLGGVSKAVGGLLRGKKKDSGESKGLLEGTGGLITDLLGGLDDTSKCKTCGESSGGYHNEKSVSYENDHSYVTEQTKKSSQRVGKESSGSYQNENTVGYENDHDNFRTDHTEKSTSSVGKKSSGRYENDNSGSYETDNSGNIEIKNSDSYEKNNDNYGAEQTEKSTGNNNRENIYVENAGSYETEHSGNYKQKSSSSYEEYNDSHYESNLVVDLFTNLGAILEQIGGELGLSKVISSLLDKEHVGGLINGVNQLLSSITGVECLPLLENNVLGSLLSAVSDLLVGLVYDVDLLLQKLLQGKEGKKGLGNLLGGVGNLLSELSNAAHFEELLIDEEFKIGLKILLKGVNSLSLDESYEKSNNGGYH